MNDNFIKFIDPFGSTVFLKKEAINGVLIKSPINPNPQLKTMVFVANILPLEITDETAVAIVKELGLSPIVH